MSNLEQLLSILKHESNIIGSLNHRFDYRYKSTQQLVLEHGYPFVNKIESPFRCNPKECFKNCVEALIHYPSLNYCEGFAIHADSSIHVIHAWLVNSNGELIDPTWVNPDFQENIYFGVKFNRLFALKIAQTTEYYGILDNDRYDALRQELSIDALLYELPRKIPNSY